LGVGERQLGAGGVVELVELAIALLGHHELRIAAILTGVGDALGVVERGPLRAVTGIERHRVDVGAGERGLDHARAAVAEHEQRARAAVAIRVVGDGRCLIGEDVTAAVGTRGVAAQRIFLTGQRVARHESIVRQVDRGHQRTRRDDQRRCRLREHYKREEANRTDKEGDAGAPSACDAT
jgi:hypothetical protein